MILDASLSKVEAGNIRELPIPDELNSAMTIQRTFSGILSVENYLLLFPERQQFLVKIPFNIDAKARHERFGKVTDQIRIPLKGAKYPGDWRGGFLSGTKLIVWDASILQLLVLRAKDLQPVQSMTVPADTLKPAADPQGEPTDFETRKTRDRFRNAMKSVFGTKYTGIAEIPSDWERKSGRKFLIASTVSGFPILMMACEKDDDTACIISRQCFLEGAPEITSKDVRGVGVFDKAREVLIGNSSQNRIEVFQFRSCFELVWKRTLQLPSRLAKLTNLHVDRDGRLWVSTQFPDSYSDANLYFWDRDTWK